MKKIAIFASGSGTNAENLITFFSDNNDVEITCVFCNKAGAGVFDRAKKLNTPTFLFSRDDFYYSSVVKDLLLSQNVDYIILAGFLWLIPNVLITEYKNKIINIHPSLLPKYGGKGMYGMKVHSAVIENKEVESGITIHLVNEKYDDGEILFQAKCSINYGDTPDDLAAKIHDLEYEHFPKVVSEFLYR